MSQQVTDNTPVEVLAKFIRQQDVYLVQLAGEGQGRSFVIPSGETVIGTDAETCTILLTDKTVSRRHCSIQHNDNQLRIRDLESTNGTAVDGVIIETAYLRPGMKIRTGNVVFGIDVGYVPLGVEPERPSGFRGLVGQSPQMKAIFAARMQLANSDVTLLIHGETGTGKSALARSIHQASKRRDEPFVVFDCAAVSPTLIESELFGHVKGSFTGADRQRVGAIETAGRGTMFIDELTELPLELQAKLLRALEERQFSMVGSQEQKEVRCRIIAASQHDVGGMVEAGKFRRDLYYRLAVVLVPLPPLRERKEDLKQIVDHLLMMMEAPIIGFSHLPENVRREIENYDWPGNVRELRNYLERYIVTRTVVSPQPLASSRDAVTPAPTGLVSQSSATLALPYKDAKQLALSQFERAYLLNVMQRASHNVSEAARLSGIARRNLHDLLMKHGLDRESLINKGAASVDPQKLQD